jgi:DNA-binding transcriptional MerR regulator
VSKSPDAFRTISEVADDLDLPQHVLRFWETRFGQIRPLKRGGGRRYYRPDDIDLLRGIRHLLYGEGYTIRGVQRILKEQGARFVVAAGRGEVPGLGGKGAVNGTLADGRREPGLGEEEDYPDVTGMAEGEADDIPEVEVEREDHDPADDMPEPKGMVGAARRLVGQLMESRAPAAPAGAGLPADEQRRLKETLAELLECKRILDSAR